MHVGEAEGAQKSVAAVEKLVDNKGLTQGLAPIYVSPHTGGFAGSQITLGARGDSYYEYLLKQWLLTGKQNDVLLRQVGWRYCWEGQSGGRMLRGCYVFCNHGGMGQEL